MQTDTAIQLSEWDDQKFRNFTIQLDAMCKNAAVYFIAWCYLRRYWECGVETFTREHEYRELYNIIEKDYLQYVDDYPMIFNPFHLYDKDKLKHILKESLTEILPFITFIKKSNFILQPLVNRKSVSSDDIMLLMITKTNHQICTLPTEELSMSDGHPWT